MRGHSADVRVMGKGSDGGLSCAPRLAYEPSLPSSQAPGGRLDGSVWPSPYRHVAPACRRLQSSMQEGDVHIGVDTHKKQHVLVALDARGQLCGTHSVINTPAGWD